MMVHEITFMDYEGDCFEEEVRDFVMQVTALFDDVSLNIDDASWLFSLFFADAKDDEFCSQKALLKLCLKFATTESDQEDLRNYLVALASDQPEGRWGVHTTAFTCLELQHALLMKQNRVEDAQAFALANLAYDGMRKIAFDHAMEIKDYALAEKLAKEKELSAYQSSDATGWSVLLFRVYQESGKKDEMRSLAKAFLLHGNLSYYPILKESYEGEEWEALVDGLLDEMQAREEGGYRKNAYPEVLKAECKQERLLTYLQRNPRLVQSYQDVMLPTYKAEVFALYKQIILEDGQDSDSRKEYNILASWLKALVRIGGGSVATECLQVLAPRYMKRPAMRDELQQVGLL